MNNSSDLKKYFYITSPIFYPNGALHIGHAYTMTITDVISRYKRMSGYQVCLQTGSDEHGEKIVRTAKKNGLVVSDLIDHNVKLFRELWKSLNISEDYFFIRTSNLSHKRKVQEIFANLLSSGDIYLGQYKGSYCLVCEEYVLNFQQCPSCLADLIEITEEAYFLKVEKYRQQLISYYEKNPYFLLPEAAFNELFRSFLEKKIPDLCVTRKSLKWGIKVPGKREMTIYVWFDALCNYLTSANGNFFFSPEGNNSVEIIHVIGKDILRFHAIYWLLILLALKKRLPNKILAHGWILSAGIKMSKSKGNVVDPLSIIRKYGSDVVRTYFIAKITTYQDGVLSDELLSGFYNDFFLNKLGNLFSRTLKMIELYRCSIIPSYGNSSLSRNYYQHCLNFVAAYNEKMNNYLLTAAFINIQNVLDSTNKLISEAAPWKLFADGQQQSLDEVLNLAANGLRIIATMLLPIAPICSQEILLNLGEKLQLVTTENLLKFDQISGKKIERNFRDHLFFFK